MDRLASCALPPGGSARVPEPARCPRGPAREVPTIALAAERPEDAIAREALLDLTMPARFEKASQRLRDGRLPAEGLSLVARGADGRLAGTVRLWHVTAGPGCPALLLGPLAVHPWFRQAGVGAQLMQAVMAEAARRGHGAILLVGDAPYYGRFGFSSARTGKLWMPGAYDRDRLLAVELMPGALDGACGLICPTGVRAQPPVVAERTAGRDDLKRIA